MRKTIALSLFSVLLLMAGAVVAELPQHRQTFGTVLSYTPDQQIVIETDDGQETFKIVANSTLPADHEVQVGDQIVVDWNVAQSADAMPEVRTIRLDDGAETQTTAATTREQDVDVEVDEDTEVTATASVETETETEDFGTETDTDVDVDADVDTRTTASSTNQQSTRSSLPQTGSNLPLVGLIGLLTLAAAATLTLRR